MALNETQVKELDTLNQKIIGGYTPTATDTKNLEYAKTQGYKIPNQINSEQITGNTPVVEPAPELQSNIDSVVAATQPTQDGLNNAIKSIMTPSSTESKISPINQRITELTGETANKLPDYQAELDKYGFKTNVQDLQNLNKQIASVKNAYDKYSVAQEGRVASAGSIYGRQALAQRQSAVELGGLSSMAEALQGNIQMAQSIAQNTIELKYEPIQAEIDNKKFQLEQVYEQLDREDKRKADALNVALTERQRLIDEQKQNDEGVYDIMLLASKNGADSATLQNIVKASNPRQAIINAGSFLSISDVNIPEKIGTDINGNDLYYNPTTGTVQTSDQLTINQLGEQVGTIKGLPSYDTRSANPGMTRSDRNNNPGNIKVSDYTKGFNGITGVESNPAEDGGNFLIFETPQDGLDAIGRLLLEGNAYQGVNAETAIKKYNGGGSYGARDVGLDPNKDFQSQIKDINKRREVAKAMAMKEGWSGGIAVGSISESSKNWAQQIKDGKATIANVPTKERSGVIDALAEDNSLSDADAAITESLNNKISQIDDLISKVSTSGKGVIGPSRLSRLAAFSFNKLSGREQEFVGSVKQLISKETLDTLINLKRAGGTLGALSDQERIMLQNAASKIGGWEKKDKNGVGLGIWNISEKSFKAELENMKKLAQTAYDRASGSTGIISVDPLDINSPENDPLGLNL